MNIRGALPSNTAWSLNSCVTARVLPFVAETETFGQLEPVAVIEAVVEQRRRLQQTLVDDELIAIPTADRMARLRLRLDAAS